jgi:hypothetical protein
MDEKMNEKGLSLLTKVNRNHVALSTRRKTIWTYWLSRQRTICSFKTLILSAVMHTDYFAAIVDFKCTIFKGKIFGHLYLEMAEPINDTFGMTRVNSIGLGGYWP